MFPRHLFLDFEGRHLFGVRPFAVWECNDGAWIWQSSRGDFPFQSGSGDALSELQNAIRWCYDNVSTQGACAGYFAYDFARQLEPRAFIHHKNQDLPIPDARLVFYEEWRNENRSEVVESEYSHPRSQDDNNADNAYIAAIEKIRDFIASGDIYQANYTQRFEAEIRAESREIYQRLLQRHPMPFSALLDWPDFSILSNSPERFFRVENNVVTAQPIKGTMRRGATPEEDESSRGELQASAKNRAENVMIVDLLRNDLGRVCEYGSVHVPQLFSIKTFPTLHHLVSTVEGKLRNGCNAVDVLRATFPCGSITGAPKIRAMQILDELETTNRGVAMGAIGYFAFNGDADWNVAIRTATCVNNTAYFHVGGGIVWDSSAQSEYSEMQLKARALMDAFKY
jgi:para-aminobenzoate synthetase component 1